jgi:hypothetical protein
MPDRKTFVELRVFVADRDQKPADLSQVLGSVILIPEGAPPMKKDLQLMMPEPAAGVPPVQPRALPDGQQVRVAIAKFFTPFQRDESAAGGPPSVYFKADVPSELAQKSTSARIELQFPSGKQKLDLPSPFGE